MVPSPVQGRTNCNTVIGMVERSTPDLGIFGGRPQGSTATSGVGPEALAPHAISHRATREPDAVALEHVGGAIVSYRQLDEQCRRWASGLATLSVGERSIVATMLPNGPTCFEVWLGLGWLRAIEAPLNPSLKGVMLAHILSDCGAPLLVTTPDLLAVVASVFDSLPDLRRVVVERSEQVDPAVVGRCDRAGVEIIDAQSLLAGTRPHGTLDGPRYHDPGALLYTSGTTGPSKGVLVTWASIYQTWSWVPSDALLPGEGLYCPFPMFHTSGKSALNSTLARGGRFVWRDRFSATDLWDDIRRTKCVAASLVGPMLSFVCSQPEDPSDADNSLRSILCGPMIPEIDHFERRFGVRVATCYSMTEIGSPLATGWEHGPWATCGRPRQDYPWTQVRVVNEFDEPLGPGQVGELVVRTDEPSAFNAGYHGLPAMDARAWRNGWFHTGDAFRYDNDGWFFLVDRMNDTIRRRGENISSFEVEQVVRDYPGVVDCAAIAVPAEHGEDEILVALECNGGRLHYSDLSGWLEERLPKFMVPRYLRGVDALPRNETSLRVQKFRLRHDGVTRTTWDRLGQSATGTSSGSDDKSGLS
jgi:crotonobetaine/carnitine-CoA ligase